MTEFTAHFPDLHLVLHGGCHDMFEPFFPEFSEQTTIPSTIFSDSCSDHKLIQQSKRDERISNPASSCGDSNEIVKIKASASNSCSRRGKRARNYEKEGDVVHVRARRGQATDKHSLAERVRRGKINEKFKYLQDIVPGCYKTMGMSMMLDETINYVRSLQNQVEFLSMKLTAASTFCDFNSEMDFVEVAHVEYT